MDITSDVNINEIGTPTVCHLEKLRYSYNGLQ